MTAAEQACLGAVEYFRRANASQFKMSKPDFCSLVSEKRRTLYDHDNDCEVGKVK